MKNIGMTPEDEEKIAAMRDYIYKLSLAKSKLVWITCFPFFLLFLTIL